MFKSTAKYKTEVAIGVIWLFHLSALIGVKLGHLDWFIEKTPINLGLSLLLFFICYPLIGYKNWLAFSLFFISGMFAEWLGVKYELFFGSYSYGSNFGPKIDGVPILIGCYWALLTFITASILDYFKLSNWIKVLFGAGLMVLLDFFIEHSAPTFDFWTFEGNVVPLQNYVSWFILATLFHILLRAVKISGSKMFALNLYLAQLLFFLFFYL